MAPSKITQFVTLSVEPQLGVNPPGAIFHSSGGLERVPPGMCDLHGISLRANLKRKTKAAPVCERHALKPC
jgi:hypothetical protein